MAVAHSILVIAYTLLSRDCTYQDLGADYFEKTPAEDMKRFLIRKLEALGHKVTLEAA